MKLRITHFGAASFLAISLLACTQVSAQPVIRQDQERGPLTAQWQKALARGADLAGEDGFWVGYEISKQMSPNSWIGSFSWPQRDDEVVLSEVLYDEPRRDGWRHNRDDLSVKETAERALRRAKGESVPEIKVAKKLATLIKLAGRPAKPVNVRYSNIDVGVNLDGKPLIWMGRYDDESSIAFLLQRYESADTTLRRSLVSAIAVHDAESRVVPLLRGFARNGETVSIRKQAVSRLGKWPENNVAFETLKERITADPSERVQKEAVYRITKFPAARSVPTLITVAERHQTLAIRKSAVYRLSKHLATTPAARDFLEKMVFSSQEPVLQKEALYRIAKLKDSDAFAFLSRVMRTHPDAKRRKDALYRLSKFEDETRVLNLLRDVVWEGREDKLKKDALYRISKRKSSAARDTLLAIAMRHPEPEMRKRAVYRLTHKSASPRVVRAMASLVFSDPSPKVRKEIVYRVSKLPGDSGVDLLLRVAREHPDTRLRKTAVSRLGKIKSESARQGLINLLNG